MKIERVEVHVVAPKAQRFTWSHDLPEQYMTNTVIRSFTDEGIEGTAGARTIRHMISIVIQRRLCGT